ncbi:Golgi-associated plant pathogenesis-related protein 1 [Toxocara canis]|uniref:Golgi-associated plant pathogenesis-related protein 1 n=1 Tax=Toxocara canis TaxID=6265 RepID=A0A0B2UU03_TOXCA|nr:Golgi-associated plant pathogenesis-related protein 1 [Toxocara canis]
MRNSQGCLLLMLVAVSCAFDVTLFKNMLQEQYNFYRALHSAPPVHLNRAISGTSERWSEVLGTQPSRVCLHHSGRGGENLFFYWAYRPISELELAEMTAKAFYRQVEIILYDFSHPGYRKSAAHFTEMIWRSVSEIGIGLYMNVYK